MLPLKSIALFIAAAIAEIGGAWLVWQGIREGKGWWWVGAGIIALGLYGFVAILQPDANFGRILAAYGGPSIRSSPPRPRPPSRPPCSASCTRSSPPARYGIPPSPPTAPTALSWRCQKLPDPRRRVRRQPTPRAGSGRALCGIENPPVSRRSSWAAPTRRRTNPITRCRATQPRTAMQGPTTSQDTRPPALDTKRLTPMSVHDLLASRPAHWWRGSERCSGGHAPQPTPRHRKPLRHVSSGT